MSCTKHNTTENQWTYIHT